MDARKMSLINFLGSNVSHYLEPNDANRLSTSCMTLYTQTKNTCQKNALAQLLQAMFEHDSSKIKRILSSYPDFLFEKPSKFEITGVRFNLLNYLITDDSIFSIAQKLLNLEVLKMTWSYFFEKLKKTNTEKEKNQLQAHWIIPTLVTQFRNEEERNKLQELYITKYLHNIIRTLTHDQTIEVCWGVNSTNTAEIDNISKKTNAALNTLKEQLLEPKAIQDSIDTVQLLIAAYRALDQYEADFLNLFQRDAYVILVIDFIKGLVEPEVRQILNPNDKAARGGLEINLLKNYIEKREQEIIDFAAECEQAQMPALTVTPNR
jgi:hypothetical protein